MPNTRDILRDALWRYVDGDSCDCECINGRWDDGDGDVPCPDPACPVYPCHYCTGTAALTAAGGLDVPAGRHTARALAALQVPA